MIMKTKNRNLSLDVEWRDKDDSYALAAMLMRNGAKAVRIYECPYTDDDAVDDHAHKRTEISVSVTDGYPEWRILADIATHSSVLSVGETEDPGLVERIIRRIFR